ncbi:hypothetical protein [Parabacteroides distasonis]|uniref:hypothetical protein n=1 Tax=Parabacteroides distasonis TaxID=823 RepID=UPI0018A0CC08|nr:hypothetical protein [Parabacteroides distasonis]MDB9154331.1 hypothetical protein [Parabacteroides distasonis]MDB9158873.1 hypothetical protein [Parabacteroides distasonis]MDB9167618.1 hypothetical protein [Parabacteroides distasonis]MDB9172176.1 hypothetical protein [Parabacteroides distasonis]MDB9195627.1 hypothetical protein [Parabacteroides distasonis]
MNKQWAQKLDKVLLDIMNDDGIGHDFVFEREQEAIDFDDLLDVLLKKGLILKDIGEDATSRVVYISLTGRAFIKNGGYTALVEEKERRERQRQEELQNQRLLLSKINEPIQTVHIHTGKPEEKKGAWGYIAGIAGLLGTIDGCFNGFQTLKYLAKQLLSLLHIQGF